MMARLITWWRALFAWRVVRNSAIWEYRENAVTGQRMAYKIGGCYQPLDFEFLRAGDLVVEPRGNWIVAR